MSGKINSIRRCQRECPQLVFKGLPIDIASIALFHAVALFLFSADLFLIF